MRNPAGIRAYQKAGFKVFGRRSECRLMGGKLWNEIQMDCLATECARAVSRGKEWGFSAWPSPGISERIDVDTADSGTAP